MWELRNEYVDADLERAVLAAATRDPEGLAARVRALPADLFEAEAQLRLALQSEASIETPSDWQPAEDPQKALA